jgi:transcriptional regulator with XRE-family HTH domain
MPTPKPNSPEELELAALIGPHVRDFREREGISQTELATALDVAPSTISYLENGYRLPRRNTVMKILEYIDIDIPDLSDRLNFIGKLKWEEIKHTAKCEKIRENKAKHYHYNCDERTRTVYSLVDGKVIERKEEDGWKIK